MGLRKKDRKDIEVPASSLADIAFLLIIFFMVASMVNTSKGLRFDLPARKSKPKTIQRHEVVIVDLKKGGMLLVDGKKVAEDGVTAALAARKKRWGISALLFRVQRGCQYGPFARVSSRIRLSGFPRFAIKGVD